MDQAVKAPLPEIKDGARKIKATDTIVVSSEALSRINEWVKQIENKTPSIRLTRSQLASWLLCHRDVALTSEEMQQIESAFFDEVRFAKWAVQELRSAKHRGEDVTLSELLNRAQTVKTNAVERRGRPRNKIKTNSKNDLILEEKKSVFENNFDENSANFLDKSEVK